MEARGRKWGGGEGAYTNPDTAWDARYRTIERQPKCFLLSRGSGRVSEVTQCHILVPFHMTRKGMHWVGLCELYALYGSHHVYLV